MTSEATVDNPAKREGESQALKLLLVFERDEDGWEVASCPTLPGCHSQGRTRHEALENVRKQSEVTLQLCEKMVCHCPPPLNMKL